MQSVRRQRPPPYIVNHPWKSRRASTAAAELGASDHGERAGRSWNKVAGADAIRAESIQTHVPRRLACSAGSAHDGPHPATSLDDALRESIGAGAPGQDVLGDLRGDPAGRDQTVLNTAALPYSGSCLVDMCRESPEGSWKPDVLEGLPGRALGWRTRGLSAPGSAGD